MTRGAGTGRDVSAAGTTAVLARPSWPVVVVVAVLHLLAAVLVVSTSPDVRPAALTLALASAALQAGCMLLIRHRPVAATVLFCALTALQLVLEAPRSGVGWGCLAYLIVRYGVRWAWPVLLGTMLAVLAVGAVADAVRYGGGAGEVLRLVGADLQFAGAQVVLAGAVGWARRTGERRARRRRDRETRRYRDAALARERERITDELNSVVLDTLRQVARLAAQFRAGLAEPPPRPALATAELQAAARRSLAAMRRVLVVLRAEPPAEPEPADAGHRRWELPPPTSGGIVLVVVAIAVTWGTDIVAAMEFSRVAIGDPELEQTVRTMSVDTGDLLSMLCLTVQLGALPWWRSAPVSAFTAATAGAVCSALNDSTNLIADGSWLFPAYGVAAGLPLVSAGVTLATAHAVVIWVSLTVVLDRTPAAYSPLLNALAGTVPVAVVWALGNQRRAARLRRDRAAAEQTGAEIRLVIEQERHRVARELHDIVAHFVSAIVIQAGAARVVADVDPRAVLDAAAHIEEYGRRIHDALPELIGLSPPAEVVALDRVGVDGLVAPMRAAGLPVTTEVVGEAAVAVDDTDLFAQRIVVEALTNVLRHAGRSATRVVVEHHADAVIVLVTDSGPTGPLTAGDGAGLGLIGMRERAELLGGDVVAGPVGNGWTVAARLPRTAPAAPGPHREPGPVTTPPRDSGARVRTGVLASALPTRPGRPTTRGDVP